MRTNSSPEVAAIAGSEAKGGGVVRVVDGDGLRRDARVLLRTRARRKGAGIAEVDRLNAAKRRRRARLLREEDAAGKKGAGRWIRIQRSGEVGGVAIWWPTDFNRTVGEG